MRLILAAPAGACAAGAGRTGSPATGRWLPAGRGTSRPRAGGRLVDAATHHRLDRRPTAADPSRAAAGAGHRRAGAASAGAPADSTSAAPRPTPATAAPAPLRSGRAPAPWSTNPRSAISRARATSAGSMPRSPGSRRSTRTGCRRPIPTAPEIFVDPELDELWQLFSQGKYAEIRSRIADRRAREPDWSPAGRADRSARPGRRACPADQRLQRQAVEDGHRHGGGHAKPPHLRLCRRAVAGRGGLRQDRPRAARARDAYIYILTNCDDPAERLATVQKAADVLPEADLAAAARLRSRRRVRGGRRHHASPPRRRHRGEPGAHLEPEDLARIEALAADDGNAADALLLGWYYYRHKEAGQGDRLVRQGAQARPDQRQGGRGLHAGADRTQALRRCRDRRLRLEREVRGQSRRLPDRRGRPARHRPAAPDLRAGAASAWPRSSSG